MTDAKFLAYEPRPAMRPFHNRRTRYAHITSHRRFGKTVACVNDMIMRAAQHEWGLGTHFAYVAPTAKQAKAVAWMYCKAYAEPFLAAPPNETTTHMDLVSGARLLVLGAENADNLRGLGLAGVVCDEFADFPAGTWQEIIRPMLADKGGFATFIGTPRGRNEFYRLREQALADPENWFSLLLPASESGILPQHELDDLR